MRDQLLIKIKKVRQKTFFLFLFIIIVVVIIFLAVPVIGIMAGAFPPRKSCGPFDNFIQFSSVQPNSPAGRAIIYCNSIPFSHYKRFIALGALHNKLFNYIHINLYTVSTLIISCHIHTMDQCVFRLSFRKRV